MKLLLNVSHRYLQCDERVLAFRREISRKVRDEGHFGVQVRDVASRNKKHKESNVIVGCPAGTESMEQQKRK